MNMGIPMPDHCFEFDDFRLEPARRRLIRRSDGRTIALTGRPLEALCVLVDRRGELVEKAALMQALWPRTVVEENNLTQTISTLRQALGDTIGEHRFIATVSGRGYRFIAKVTVADPATDQPVSIAVLPFVNLTGDITKEYWGDGIAEELIVSLGRVVGLRVPARISSFAYKGRLVDVREIGKDLAVAAVVEGSVRSVGDRIRVSAHLNDATSGYRMWSDTYDRHFSDLFELQDDLAKSILEALVKQLGLDLAKVDRPSAGATDVEAYRLYMQGCHLMDRMSLQNNDQAVACFRSAIAIDPGFARAHGALATGLLGYNPLGCQTFERLAECRKAAEHALTLDRSLSDAHDSLGAVAFFLGDWKLAKSQIDIALSLGVRDAAVHWHYAMWLVQLGQLSAASFHAERAYALAPASASSVCILALTKSFQGDDAEAIRLANLAADLGTSRHSRPLAAVYEAGARRQGRYADAAAALLAGVTQEKSDLRLFAEAVRLIYTALESGNGGEEAAFSVLSLYERGLVPGQLNTDGYIWAMASAESLIALNAVDEVFALCNLIADAMAPIKALLFLRPACIWRVEWAKVRLDPRFAALAKRVGLVDAWKHFGPPDGAKLFDETIHWLDQ
jgi:TolB-like protein/Tfp pilus assembly protein PilF